MAEQEQGLITRLIGARICYTRQDPRCRLFKDAHNAGCKMLAGTAYLEQHNQVAGMVYRYIFTQYELEFLGSKWDNRHFLFQTDKMVLANQPGIVVVVKQDKKAVVVDVAIK